MTERRAINLTVEHAVDGEPITSAQVGAALLDALKTDTVTRFAAEVQAAIEASRAPYKGGNVQRTDTADSARREIEKQIAALQSKLLKLEAA